MTDDGPAKSHMYEAFKELGTIGVSLLRVRQTGIIPGDRPETFKPVCGDSKIPEKTLKGRAISSQAKSVLRSYKMRRLVLTHSRLAAAEAVSQKQLVDVDYPYGKEPFTTAIYKYRSRSTFPDSATRHLVLTRCRGPADRRHNPT